MSLSSGARLGPYEIVSAIGAGGMGEVYRARDPRLGRDVAIKVLPGSFSSDPDRLRRFEQEAKAAGVLNHPNITAVYDVGSQDGAPYVVSELLEGETLRARLAGGAFTPRKALGHALQIAHGLAAAHEKGIVHRDLKPENIFVTRDGRVKILDFGLAKLMQPEDSTRPQTDLPTVGSEPGVALGTLGYMSPEQVRGKPADPRSDIFSFGAILYEMLSGKRAFHGDSAADTMSAILKEDPPDLSATNRQIPPGLERIVRHCLEKNPEQRFHSAHDLAFDLEALSDVSGPASFMLGLGRKPFVRPKAAWLIAGSIAALAGVAVVAILQRSRAETIDSLAVLPFANVGSDPNLEYLSDGITDNLVNSLSQLPQLRVTARTIATRYKGKDADPQKAGRELGVSAVLSGRVLQHGDALTIQADLVKVVDGSQLWGGRFNSKLSDIQTVQEEIAGRVSSKLRARLTGEEKKRLTKRYTENPEAYQLYLKGRHFWEQRTGESLKKSIGYFNQAIERDPAYSLAYAGLADSYAVLSVNNVMPPRDCFPKATAAARKALQIDSALAQPHATLGAVLMLYDWDWAAAEAEFKTVIALDSDYATAHHWYGFLLAALGRFDEAIEELRRATQLDPLSAVMQTNTARVLLYARQFDRAVEEARKGIEMNPELGHLWLGVAYETKGTLDKAIAEFQQAMSLTGGLSVSALTELGCSYARSGRRREAQQALETVRRLSTERYVPPLNVARLYQDLGEKDQAFEWLEKAYIDRSANVIFLKVNPLFDSVRSDPRFTDLLRRLKLAS